MYTSFCIHFFFTLKKKNAKTNILFYINIKAGDTIVNARTE